MKRPVPQALMLVGCLGVVLSSFIHWTSGSNFWQADQSLHFKLLAAVLVVVTGALCVLALRRRDSISRSLTGAAGLLAGGVIVGYGAELSSFHVKFGGTLALLAGIVISIGGLLAVLQREATPSALAPASAPAPAPARSPAPGPAPAPASADRDLATNPAEGPIAQPSSDRGGLTEPVPAGVPAGWYEDPSGQHSERRWDGNAWTDDTR